MYTGKHDVISEDDPNVHHNYTMTHGLGFCEFCILTMANWFVFGLLFCIFQRWEMQVLKI